MLGLSLGFYPNICRSNSFNFFDTLSIGATTLLSILFAWDTDVLGILREQS
jgi:hypothetical protein